jgi:hypothetical protein
MKSALLLLTVILISIYAFSQVEIRREIEEANAELSQIYGFSVK